MDEDDGPLTLAEEELTYSPLPLVRDSTLGDQALKNSCPLGQRWCRSKPRYDLGTLDLLPLEILGMVLLYVCCTEEVAFKEELQRLQDELRATGGRGVQYIGGGDDEW